ncbi:MAG TPA: zinc ribbon domain-containing protein [Ktedonobacteraceae bacterium]|nr:zinc ribbon domain-containing protein [Ktedonobacteraceae bacterium]
MSQASGRPCPACGTPVPAGQRFCSNCGTDLTVSGPASQYGGQSPQNYPQAPYGQQQQVPPYAQAPGAFGQQQQQISPYQQPPQKSNPIAEALGALGLLFFLRRYRPGYQARRQSSGCCGCLVTLVILLLIFGTPAFFYYRANPNVFNQVKNQIQHSSNNTGNSVDNGSVPTTQPPITTANINQSVTYAGVNITIVSVQQSTAFIDDNSTASNGMVRINVKEANNSGKDSSYFFSDIAHLILPDKSSVAPVRELQTVGPQNGTTRDNWLDFAAPTSAKIDQMTLVLGGAQDAQEIIPLQSTANLSAFQPRTINPNLPISYGGLNWTLQSATRTLSVAGKQASKGMRYVVLTFKVDNPTSGNVVIGFTDEYMRLKSADVTNPTIDSTLPTTINASTNGITGTVTFLMPENNTAFTLIFLSKQGGSNPQPNPQVNTNFKIQ